MGRYVDPLLFGPPGVCPECLRPCQGLHQVGITCYHCKQAVFLHRREWTYEECPACHGLFVYPQCGRCDARGFLVSRR